MAKNFFHWAAVALLALPLLGAGSCGVKQTETLPPGQVPELQTATLEELLARLEQQEAALTSINAEAELRPTTGSAYSGVIERYHDVKTFILAERLTAQTGPSRQIRVIGQSPIVRKTVFDMVADENHFRVYVPPKNKFIVGPTKLERRSEKPIENLRPQHILEAIFLPGPDGAAAHFREENEWGGQRYYAVTEIQRDAEGGLRLHRRWWFERARLRLMRMQRFDPQGRLMADIHYSDWRDLGGLAYPYQIEIVRPHDDYRLKILVQELTLNQPLPPGRFQLERPEGVELVELKEEPEAEPESEPANPAEKSP